MLKKKIGISDQLILRSWSEMSLESKREFYESWRQDSERFGFFDDLHQERSLKKFQQEQFAFYQASNLASNEVEVNQLMEADWKKLPDDERAPYWDTSSAQTPFQMYAQGQISKGVSHKVIHDLWTQMNFEMKRCLFDAWRKESRVSNIKAHQKQ